MEYLLLVGGFVALFFSGNYLVKGSVALAQHLKISTLVIAVTVVSFGTSAPELLVSIRAALEGHPDISLGNVIGSNISNIALVLGLTGLIMPISIKSNSIKFDWPFMMLASILLYIFCINYTLSFWEGIIFVTFILVFILWSIWFSKKSSKKRGEIFLTPSITLFSAISLIAISAIGLIIGAQWLIDGATDVARNFGVSERVISVSVIAFGTSVPELATSIIAAFRKEMDISIGNIIGSNIFNIFAILGITSIVNPLNVSSESLIRFDIPWMIGTSLLLLFLILPLEGGKLTRIKASVLVLSYISYIYFIFFR